MLKEKNQSSDELGLLLAGVFFKQTQEEFTTGCEGFKFVQCTLICGVKQIYDVTVLISHNL